MKITGVILTLGLFLLTVPVASASASHLWQITSPRHEQTFAFGSELRHAWSSSPGGTSPHLVLYLSYTNDPYINEDNPPMRDDFCFDFPNVKLQPDGRTFSYLAPDGHLIPVAMRKSDFLGIPEVRLLPTSGLFIKKPHGYLTVSLKIID